MKIYNPTFAYFKTKCQIRNFQVTGLLAIEEQFLICLVIFDNSIICVQRHLVPNLINICQERAPYQFKEPFILVQ